MRIAVIAPTFIPAKRANTLQVMKMTQAIANVGHTVILAVPEEPGKSRNEIKEWGEMANWYGLTKKFPIDYLPALAKFRRYDFALRAVKWAKRWSADLIYTRLPQAAAYAAFQGLGTIFEAHDIPQGSFGPFLFYRFLQGRGARRLLVISKALAADLRKQFNTPDGPPFTMILPDGVDLERYSGLPAPRESRQKLKTELKVTQDEDINNLSVERFTIGYTGHLYPGRGIDLILELAIRLQDSNFLIVGGESRDVERVKRIVAAKGLNNVLITGFVPNAELPLYQAASDVLLMPYQRRVAASSGGDIARYLSPMKLFEYMACGRAICSSNLPVLQEILSEESAILLPPDDIEAWTTALMNLQEKPALGRKLANKAQEAAAQYSWETRASKMLDNL